MIRSSEVPSAAPPSPVTAGDLLTLEELRALRKTSDRRGAWLVCHAWATIVGAAALYVAWPSAVTLLLAVVLIGGRQLGLMVLMHEAAHWLLFSTQPLNTRIGTWLCAGPMGADLAAYRRSHHLHHRHTWDVDDPDRPSFESFPVTRSRLALGALGDLCGLTALLTWCRWRPWQGDVRSSWKRWRAPLFTNAVLFGACAAFGQWQLYLVLWVLPWATWFQLVTRVRAVAEHGGLGPGEDALATTRTVVAGPCARAIAAPYWVNYHLEHHLLVFVPCWKLADARGVLLRKGLGPRIETLRGYGELVRRVGWKPRRAEACRQT